MFWTLNHWSTEAAPVKHGPKGQGTGGLLRKHAFDCEIFGAARERPIAINSEEEPDEGWRTYRSHFCADVNAECTDYRAWRESAAACIENGGNDWGAFAS